MHPEGLEVHQTVLGFGTQMPEEKSSEILWDQFKGEQARQGRVVEELEWPQLRRS